jgi:hypothetical protein
MIRLNLHPFQYFRYLHRRLPAQQVGQNTVVVGVQMLHHDEGHSGIHRKVGQQIGDRFDAPCRGSNPDNDGVGFPSTRRSSSSRIRSISVVTLGPRFEPHVVPRFFPSVCGLAGYGYREGDSYAQCARCLWPILFHLLAIFNIR